MLRAYRQREILRQISEEGFIQVADLSRRLRVDASTVRRDLAALARAGLVERARGGALRADPGDVVDIPYDVKRGVAREAKAAIGRVAAGLVRRGQTILLDSGSTTRAIVPWLRGLHVTVVTNDLEIAHNVARQRGNRLIVLGGALIETVFTLVGPQTIAELAELHVDQAFLGADAIDLDAGITNVNVVEVAVKRAMVAAASRTTVLADSSKFDRQALARVVDLAEVDAIVTDDGMADLVRQRYRALNLVWAPLAVPAHPARSA